jgi:hypothetical protein
MQSKPVSNDVQVKRILASGIDVKLEIKSWQLWTLGSVLCGVGGSLRYGLGKGLLLIGILTLIAAIIKFCSE